MAIYWLLNLCLYYLAILWVVPQVLVVDCVRKKPGHSDIKKVKKDGEAITAVVALVAGIMRFRDQGRRVGLQTRLRAKI